MTLIALFITAALLTITNIMILNVLTFPRVSKNKTPLAASPLVSVLIPARNEAHIIQQTLTAHLNQTYPNIEIILLDDHSEDNTYQIASTLSANNPSLTIIEGEPLPVGWMGKSWACHQLSQHANGDILIFTDADVQWQPTALTNIIHSLTHNHADLLTVWATQQTRSWAERLTVPLIAYAIFGYLPAILTHTIKHPSLAAANGQCMVWRKSAYQAIGGHTRVANNVLDDVTLAKATTTAGYKLYMMDGNRQIQTRMYHDWQSVRAGFAKNILAGYGNSIPALLVGTIFHLLLFLFPLIMLTVDGFRIWGFLLITLGIILRALSAYTTHQRPQDALLMPISVLLMTIIAFQSIYWNIKGINRWKGRIINTSLEENQTT